MLIFRREELKPLLGKDWLRDIIWKIHIIESTTKTTDQSKKERIKTNFGKLFKTNQTVEDTEVEIQLELGQPPIKTKARFIRYHLQTFVEKEGDIQIKSGHPQKKQTVEGDCFVSPLVVTVEKNSGNCLGLTKNETEDAKYGGSTKLEISPKTKSKERTVVFIKNKSRVRVRSKKCPKEQVGNEFLQ